jgi:hypothetical protein
MKAITKNRAITFSVSVYPGLSPHDLDAYMAKHSEGLSRRQWIPQTMCDCVWLWYEYETPARRNEVLASLPQSIREHMREFSQIDLNYWMAIDGTDGSF